MGIPGGSKKDGMKQLEAAMQSGVYTPVEARVYLAKNLRNYDQQYGRAAQLLEPLVDQYPANPLFHLLLGDMYAKLGRKEKAAAQFRAAKALATRDIACAARVQQIAQTALTDPRLAGND
jgi:Flp pilus assembly protein TadD